MPPRKGEFRKKRRPARIPISGIPASSVENGDGKRTLWRASLSYPGGGTDQFLFRERDDFEQASKTAIDLRDGSPACSMANAQIVSVERVAPLWN